MLLYTFGQKDLIFDHYGIDAGYNYRDAKNIITTKNGMVWISSDNGLVRFDGKKFKTFKNIKGDTNSISSNNINSLIVDKRGLVWIGGFNEIHIFNPRTETFKNIKFPYEVKDAIRIKPFPFCFSYNASKDILWIGTKSGLYYCKGNTYDIKSVQTITKEQSIKERPIYSIASENDETLWVTFDYTIVKFNTVKGTVENYTVPAKINRTKNDPQYSYISCSFLDKNKILWLGSSQNGLIEFNTITKSINQYYFNNTPNNIINCITQISTNKQNDILYIATSNYGIAKFNTNNKQFQLYKSQFINEINGIKNNAYGLHVDPSNALWIGSDNGIYKLDINRQVFDYINLETLLNTTENTIVTRIECEQTIDKKDKKIWFYMPDVGCYIYDVENKKIVSSPKKVKKYLSPYNDFYSFFIDSKNRIWINNNKYGLICYSISEEKIIIPELKYFFTKENWVTTFYEDKSKNVWFGTTNGLYIIENLQTEVKPINEVINLLEERKLSKNINSITEDVNGKIWFIGDVSTKPNACIATYDIKTKTCSIVYAEKSNLKQINKINNLEELSIKNNTIFVLDFGTGLMSFSPNKKNAEFINISEKNNQIPNYIRSFVEDNSQNLWCSTVFGVSHLIRSSENFINYKYTSFMLSDNKYPNLFFSKQSGKLYIAQANGIRFTNTNTINDNQNKSELIFTEFKIFDKEFKLNNKPIENSDKIVLEHNQNMLSIEFALLSYFNSNENLYSWKLDGLEKNWNTSKNNYTTYTNLQPGTYTFLVKAANSNGVWCSKLLKLIIKIKPPFYKTWWFLLFCTTTIGCTIYYFVQQRFIRLKEKYTLQNKIASDLHDEVGSTLTSINILSNISQKAFSEKPDQAMEMLGRINTQSKMAQQNISDIVWSIRPDNESGESLLVRMREFASLTLEPLNIKIVTDFDKEITNIVLSMQVRKELLLIFKEAISNIVKHAQATFVQITFKKNGKRIDLLIQDNGTWKGQNSGTGTKTMKERTIAIGGKFLLEQNTIGTLVKISFSVP